MERVLEVTCSAATSRFTTRKLSRATLYGRKRRLPVDAQGRECRAAALTRDGQFLLPPGSTATLYLDEDREAVERNELYPARAEQDAVPTCGPQFVEPAELLDYTIRQVYALDPVTVSEQLEGLLAETDICRLADGDETGKARFLVKNDAGYFLLVGEQAGFEFVGPDQADLSVPDADAPWDDLDIAMLWSQETASMSRWIGLRDGRGRDARVRMEPAHRGGRHKLKTSWPNGRGVRTAYQPRPGHSAFWPMSRAATRRPPEGGTTNARRTTDTGTAPGPCVLPLPRASRPGASALGSRGAGARTNRKPLLLFRLSG